jgi:tetratricopeptide (TPR) repeat protein
MQKFITCYQIFFCILITTMCQGQKLLELTSNHKVSELFRNSLKEQQDGKFIDADSLIKEAFTEDSSFVIALLLESSPDSIERKKRLERVKRSYSNFTNDQKLFVDLNMHYNEKDTALKITNQLFHSYPEDYYLLTQLFYPAMRHEDYDLAQKLLDTIITQNRNFPPAYNLYGYFFIIKKDFENALKYFNKYLELAPTLANAYDSNGDYYMAVKEYDKAVEYFEKAYSMDSRNFVVSKEKAEKAKEAKSKKE